MNSKNSKNISRHDFMKGVEVATATMAFDWNQLEALAGKIRPKKEYPDLFFYLKV